MSHGSATVAQNLAHAAEAEGMVPVPHGTTNTTVEGQAEPGEHHVITPTALGLDGTGWVSLAMIAVILIMLWKKVPAMIGGMLDKKIVGIREQLDRATALRVEAEALKAEYEKKAAAAEADAASILAQANEDAAGIRSQAERDAADLITRRGHMAEDKIAAAERAAIAEVRAKAAAAAATAAGTIIAARHDAVSDKALIDRTIGAIAGARLN
jgi:F-type H+-transporting ATPase subunit b